MDEPRTPGSIANEGQNQQSDPGQRMRNIMDGSDANDQQMREQPAAAGDESKSDSAPQPAGSGVEDTPAPTAPVSDTQRHPTGDPDATGGWYQAEPLAPQPPAEQPESDPHAAATRVTPVADGTPADATIVSHSEPSFPNTNTIPVPGRTGARYRGQNPRRVEQSDPNATRVTPAAYSTGRSRPSASQAQEQTRAVPPRRGRPTTQAAQPSSSYPPTYRRSVGMQGPAPARQAVPPSGWKRGLGCLLRLMIALIFVVIFLVLAAGSWLVIQYFTIAQGLPPVEQLRQNASQFETTRIYDRNGGVLYEIIDPNAGRRTTVPLQRISPYVVAATIATEDREFYNHPGFDPVAIARAFYQNYTSGEVVSGASTITQQLARTLLLSPEERFERSYERKAREIVLAAEITRTYSKDEILALYLNESNYGNLAYGIEAAAETYFGKTASDLTLGQAAFLAGLPQSPAVHDIFTNREGTLNRQKQVVLLMLEASQIKGCIYVSNSTQRVCVDEAAAVQAVQEIETYNFQMAENNLRYPHWVTYIRALLEAQFDPQTIYRSGFNVYTTLDPVLQDQAQAIVSQQVASLADRNAFNGALVALRPSTGEILAMVGSPDFNDEAHSGQVNMAVSPRQPGSSIKPLTYVAAFEKGWTPATLIWDVPSEFPPSGDPSDTREPYRPVNYDGRFHGPATLRSALANSYNIPAVKALQFVGIYNEGGLIQFAQRLGINTLTRPDYGLSLTLGGGEVTLLDMTSAFSAFANQGKRVAPVSILRITDYQGNPVYEYQPTVGQQVIRPEHAYLISSILSDNAAREPMFGANSVLNLPFQAAAKTGTTNDFRDNWTIGYTPDLAVGVWIGNADYTEMQNVTGLTGAAPAWSSFMQVAVPMLTNNSPTPFQRPAGVEERVVCVYSGTEPSEFCPQQRSEIFAAGQPPLPKEQDLWRRVNIDTWTGLRASAVCGEFTKEIFTLNVEDPWAINWIKDTDDGRAWAANLGFNAPITFVPARECNTSDPRPNIFFSNLSDNQTIVTSPLDIYVIANATANFQSFRVEWGPGDDPVEWQPLTESIANQYANPERVAAWDLSSIPSGRVTLRLYMQSTDGERFAERRIHLNLNVPTPTPTPTPTMTITPSPTPTFTPTITPSITPTPSPTSSPTPTSTPTITPQPTATIGA